MEWPRKSVSVAPRRAFGGEELEVVLARALEQRPHCLDMSRRIGVGDDLIVDVGHHLLQTSPL